MVYIFAFSMLHICKELVQMYQQTRKYLVDFINYVETVLYVAAFTFVLPVFNSTQSDVTLNWEFGCVALFIAWLNLLLFLQRLLNTWYYLSSKVIFIESFRLDSIGLYVVMFRHILRTILKVFLTFSVLFVAFGLTFYLLLCSTDLVRYIKQ